MLEATKKEKDKGLTCPEERCDGGTVEHYKDVWDWRHETHSTKEWSEPCDVCRGTGEVSDDSDV
jgi:hypothetical protein